MSRTTGGRADEREKVQSIFNGKPDVLTAIVKHRTHQRGHLGYLYITRMTLDNVTVAIHPPPGGDEQEVQLKIDPSLSSGTEARDRLYEWQAKAFEHFDVPEYPAITYFSPPAPFPYAIPLFAALCVQLFALFGQGLYADAFRSKIAEWGGRGLLPASAVLSGSIHLIIYPIYLFVKLPQHRVPYVASVNIPTRPSVSGVCMLIGQLKWMLCTVVVGIGGLNELWNCIEYEKIRHIYSRTDVGRLPPRIESGASVPKAKIS